MTSEQSPPAVVTPTGFGHVRLTVTDIARSKAFYEQLFGATPDADFSDQIDDPDIKSDPQRLYGGCVFAVGDVMLGLRPVADDDDTFRSNRVGLDHVSFKVASPDEIHAAARALDAAGIHHGDVSELTEFGMVILSVQDPDDINLELSADLDD